MKNSHNWILFLSFTILFIMIPLCQAGEKPILIGATVSLEGKYVETSAMVKNGYKLWVEQINKNGGLLGRPVKLILYNDKSQKSLAASLYEKMIVEDKVDLTLSPYGTPLTMIASEATEKHGYVMLACAAAGEQIWERGYKYIFGVYAPADRYFIGFLDVLARNGFESLGLIFENSSFNISIAKGVRGWAERFNLNVTYDKGFDDAGKELPLILKQVMEKNIDGLIFSGYPPECYTFIDLMKKVDYRPKSITFTITPILPGFYEKVGPFAEGIFAPSQWEPDERIPFQRFSVNV
ncbi:MAG: amino acid ABC transporter substrate-binding protein [Deltaproteobacteria bacterium]|nr:amino acid ABC transporter substrate-binding protein [Candidatus Desulfobacula maris]